MLNEPVAKTGEDAGRMSHLTRAEFATGSQTIDQPSLHSRAQMRRHKFRIRVASAIFLLAGYRQPAQEPRLANEGEPRCAGA